jgi:hypothetical protein
MGPAHLSPTAGASDRRNSLLSLLGKRNVMLTLWRHPMSDPVDALVMDLLEWIGPRGRPYAEVIDAWRTSCPRLPVWEEANARGYIVHESRKGTGRLVTVSPLGVVILDQHRGASELVVDISSAPRGDGPAQFR